MGAGKRRLEAAAENVTGRGAQSYQNVSRETLWYDLSLKSYKASYVRRRAISAIARQAKFAPMVSPILRMIFARETGWVSKWRLLSQGS